MHRIRWIGLFLAPTLVAAFVFAIVSYKPVPRGGKVAGAAITAHADEPQSQLPPQIVYAPFGAKDLNAVYAANNLTVYPEDRVRIIPTLSLGLGGQITIERATPITLKDGSNAQVTIRTWKKTLKEALNEHQIELGELDSITPGADAAVKPDLAVAITRVEETNLDETQTIPFQTQQKEDPNLDKGKTNVQQDGQNGQKVLTYKVRRENGKEVKRTLLNTKVTKDPVTKIVIIGTKVVLLGKGIATWFPISGMRAAHNSLPRGTKVLVRNLSNNKTVIVEIAGGGIYGSAIIDLSPDAFKAISSAGLGAGVLNVQLEVP